MGFVHFSWKLQGMEELWYSLLCRTSELETKVALAREEIIKKEDELGHVKDFLSRAIKERDEAELKCQSIMLDILILQQQLQQQKHGQEQQKEEEIGAQNEMEQEAKESPLVDQHFPNCFDTESEKESRDLDLPPSAEKLVAGKALPEKGKLLQAVMEAGPLLHTLLLAGPLPQWQHPPPRVDSKEIPPVAISRPPKQSFLCQDSCFSHKRSLPHSADSVFNSNAKYQRVLY